MLSDLYRRFRNFCRPAFAKVSLFAGMIILLETVLFHVLEYVHDYVSATMVISYAILGIGLGSFSAYRIQIVEEKLFVLSALGTTGCLALSGLLLVGYPAPWVLALSLASVFFFPALYIAAMFRTYAANEVYLFDMLGVFAGVVVTLIMYELLLSEEIVLLVALAMVVVALIAGWRRFASKTRKGLLLVALLGAGVLAIQCATDFLNIYSVLRMDKDLIDRTKIFRLPGGGVTSYDNLVGRVDVTPRKTRTVVSYNGWPNDHFTENPPLDYESHFKGRSLWPSRDIRFLYGVVPEPQILVIGSAAQGIIKSLRSITPLANLHAVEINPAIIEVMTRDFYQQSGRAYEGLDPVIGNAISVLKEEQSQYDMITLMNVHSGRTVSYLSAPDTMHTMETYGLLFDRLTDVGYLMFEERPIDRRGELGLHRMINTLWQTLEQRGAPDPTRHFVLWEWQGHKSNPHVRRNRDDYYVSMLVSKQPLVGHLREGVAQWFENVGPMILQRRPFNVLFFGGIGGTEEYQALFHMIEENDFSALAEEDFDSTPITNDRPFPAMSRHGDARLSRLISSTGLTMGILWLFFSATLKRQKEGPVMALNVYNVLIGIAYFTIEVILLQAYQNVFQSPSTVLLLVLGLLLFSSGVGGFLCRHISTDIALALVIPTVVVGAFLPSWMLVAGAPLWTVKVTCIFFISGIGFLLGGFFPRGLLLADEFGLRSMIPILFALNSIGGAFAVPVALVVAIKWGYTVALGLGLTVLLSGGILYKVLQARKASQEQLVV